MAERTQKFLDEFMMCHVTPSTVSLAELKLLARTTSDLSLQHTRPCSRQSKRRLPFLEGTLELQEEKKHKQSILAEPGAEKGIYIHPWNDPTKAHHYPACICGRVSAVCKICGKGWAEVAAWLPYENEVQPQSSTASSQIPRTPEILGGEEVMLPDALLASPGQPAIREDDLQEGASADVSTRHGSRIGEGLWKQTHTADAQDYRDEKSTHWWPRAGKARWIGNAFVAKCQTCCRVEHFQSDYAASSAWNHAKKKKWFCGECNDAVKSLPVQPPMDSTSTFTGQEVAQSPQSDLVLGLEPWRVAPGAQILLSQSDMFTFWVQNCFLNAWAMSYAAQPQMGVLSTISVEEPLQSPWTNPVLRSDPQNAAPEAQSLQFQNDLLACWFHHCRLNAWTTPCVPSSTAFMK